MSVLIRNRSSTGEHDEWIGTITLLANHVSLVFSLIIIPLVALVLSVIVKERAYSHSAFFTIYKAGLFYDIIAIATTLIFRIIPVYGLFEETFTSTPHPAQIILFVNYFTRPAQGLTNLFVCLNRASAILIPLLHEKIWKNRVLLPLCFLFQLASSATIGSIACSFGVHWLRYPQGQLYAMPHHSQALYMFWLVIFLPILSLILIIVFLYVLILFRFRSSLKTLFKLNDSSKDYTESKQTSALFLIALCNIAMEIVYCFGYFRAFVFKRDYRIFFALNIAVSNCYSSLPCFLLCIFCKGVRRDVFRFVRITAKESSSTSVKSIAYSNVSNAR